jgi:hypothetical protein
MLLAPEIVLMVIAIVVLYVLILIGELSGLKALGIHTDGSVLAFFYGFILATFLCIVIYISIVYTGAVTYLTGGIAEKWTRREFSKLGPQWHLFSNVPFSVGQGDNSWIVDVDLIAVGPYGVLVVECKYSSSPIDLSSPELEKRTNDAIVQVEDNAGRVRALLLQVAPQIPIRPVIVFWGRLVKPPNTSVRRVSGRNEDVRILHGGDAKQWRPRLMEVGVLAPGQVAQASEKIAKFQANSNSNTSRRD